MIGSRTGKSAACGLGVTGVALTGLLIAALLCTACKSGSGKGGDVATRAEEELADVTSAPERTVVSVADDGGVLSIRPYDGDRSGDARLEPLLRELQRVAANAAGVAASDAGLEFGPGRGPVAELVDDDAPERGDVAIRVVDGVRRPLMRLPATGLVNGTFLPASHFAPLVIEAAVLTAAGDRSPPPWLLKGLAVELSGSFDRVMHERALGGDVLRVSEGALFPLDVPDDGLAAATRVRALERIARGDGALARFVAARLGGDIEDEALDVVGVQGALFLDAAADTERAQALEDLALGGPLGALAAAREALADESPARAAAVGPVLRQALSDGDANEFVASEVRIVLAQIALEQGDVAAAARHVRAAGTPADALLRPAEARMIEARVAKAAGESAAAARLYRGFAVDFPEHPFAAVALAEVGISEDVAAAAPGVAGDMVSDDPRVRARAAVALGESGEESAAPALRELTRDTDDDVRRMAFAGLGLVLGDAAVADLERGTRDDAAAVRAATLSMLAFASPERGAERAKTLAEDDDPAVRKAAERPRGSRTGEAGRAVCRSPHPRPRSGAPARRRTLRARPLRDRCRRGRRLRGPRRRAPSRRGPHHPAPPVRRRRHVPRGRVRHVAHRCRRVRRGLLSPSSRRRFRRLPTVAAATAPEAAPAPETEAEVSTHGDQRSEGEWTRALRERVGTPRGQGVLLGPGDDAAVLSPPGGEVLVATADLLVEGRHFVLEAGGATARDVGWKALAVSVSDVAAMGARALWALVTVALPRARRGAFADELLEGLLGCADRYGVALVGGDTTGSPGPVVVDVTVIGSTPSRPLLRSGALVGDTICVTGALGGTLLGRHLRPEPRQEEALSLVQGGGVHAMIDVSDGLSTDLGHLLDASGVGARVRGDRVPIHDDARQMSEQGDSSPLEHALHDGEDYELLFTCDPDRADALAFDGVRGTPVTRLGSITEERSYLLVDGADGAARAMERQGHDHFRAD